ncbi:MAG: hypothetical protein HYY52_07230 [Candidatus Melainabacteria bacterium]|nr:hypothetical protein [Candidatus Melainabacteria bacterium]
MTNTKAIEKGYLQLRPTGRNESRQQRTKLEKELEPWMREAQSRTGHNLPIVPPKSEHTTRK